MSKATAPPQRALNPQQELAAAHVHGPMLVRAGAGTGKTTVMAERIFRLVRDGHAQPEQILAITFTRDAAKQLSDKATARLEAQLGPGAADGLRTATFHGCCQEILERTGKTFTVLETVQLVVFLNQALDQRKFTLKHFIKASDTAKYLRDFVDFYDRCNDELVDAATYTNYVDGLRTPGAALPRVSRSKEVNELTREEIISRCEEIASVFTTIERLLAEKNIGPYGQQIVRAVKLLKNDTAFLEQERQRTKFLLIDEFQDCNFAQIAFAQLMAGPQANVFAVGDPDQAIYRFRGASSGAFDEFLRLFAQAKVTTLAENYRSTQTILDVAHSVIALNPEGGQSYSRSPLKAVKSAAPNHPVDVVLNDGEHSAEQEAHDIAQSILDVRGSHPAKWSDFAVLYRGHIARRHVMQELAARHIPFVVIGIDLLETDTLRDLVAVLRVLDSPADSLSLFRLAIIPQFNVDLADLQHHLAHAPREQPLIETLKATKRGSNVLSFLAKLRADIDAQRTRARDIADAAILGLHFDMQCEEIVRFRVFVKQWDESPLSASGSLHDFIRYLDYFLKAGGELQQEKPAKSDAVQLMTVHAAKGLEFSYVFVVRVCSGTFPANYNERLFDFPDALRAAQSVELYDDKELHAHEERRLFYVSITRARRRLWLHGKKPRGKERFPKLFLRELAAEKRIAPLVRSRDAEPVRFDIAASAQQPLPAWLEVARAHSSETMILSDSAIERYETCPLKFKLAREWKLPSEPLANMQFGQVMHQVLHEYYKSVMAKRPYPAQQVLERFQELWRALDAGEALQRELYEKNGLEQLREFLAENSGKQVIATERSFELMIGGVKLIGRVDRIDALDGNRVEIIDYKTGKPKDASQAKKSLQLSIYALAAQRAWGYIPTALVLHNLEDNSRAEVAPSAESLADVEEKITKVAENIRAGNFEAKPGHHCRWCNYYSLCPSTRQEVVQISVANAAVN